jgi:hypothetical protein
MVRLNSGLPEFCNIIVQVGYSRLGWTRPQMCNCTSGNPRIPGSREACHRAVTVQFGRQGTGWEIAYAALFLISNESSYINAHMLFLDAGHGAGTVRG